MSALAHIMLMAMMLCLAAVWGFITNLLARDLRHKFWPSLMAWLTITFVACGIALSLLYLDGQIGGICHG